jgi:hypothetical protein
MIFRGPVVVKDRESLLARLWRDARPRGGGMVWAVLDDGRVLENRLGMRFKGRGGSESFSLLREKTIPPKEVG